MKRKINATQNNNSKRRAPKSNKTIINCSEYNKALVERGNISVYISEAMAKKAFHKSRKTHKVGHPQVYRGSIIELILTLRELFRLPLRQSSGFVSNLKSRREEGQYTEQCIRASLINRFNKLGLPKYAI